MNLKLDEIAITNWTVEWGKWRAVKAPLNNSGSPTFILHIQEKDPFGNTYFRAVCSMDMRIALENLVHQLLLPVGQCSLKVTNG